MTEGLQDYWHKKYYLLHHRESHVRQSPRENYVFSELYLYQYQNNLFHFRYITIRSRRIAIVTLILISVNALKPQSTGGDQRRWQRKGGGNTWGSKLSIWHDYMVLHGGSFLCELMMQKVARTGNCPSRVAEIVKSSYGTAFGAYSYMLPADCWFQVVVYQSSQS